MKRKRNENNITRYRQVLAGILLILWVMGCSKTDVDPPPQPPSISNTTPTKNEIESNERVQHSSTDIEEKIKQAHAFQRLDTPEGDTQAFSIYKEVAESTGDAEAQLNLGMHYLNGCGVSFDGEKALTWLKRSAEQGNAMAQYNP